MDPKSTASDFDPSSEPGGHGAAQRGCTCPKIDNHHGKGYQGNPQAHIVDPMCPLHKNDQSFDDDYMPE